MIKSIFFTRFHPEKGPRVIHQVPAGTVIPTRPSATSSTSSPPPPPLFSFPAISSHIIPRQEFCDRLATVCCNRYRVIGYPICIEGRRYERNQFIFNFALVLDEDVDWSPFGGVVRKLARVLRNLEEWGGFLSRDEGEEFWERAAGADENGIFGGCRGGGGGFLDEDEEEFGSRSIGDSGELPPLPEGEPPPLSLEDTPAPHTGGKVYALCEMILEDLNNYCECMIPIDDTNTINLKLFPTRPPPAPIRPHHVPLTTVQLSTLTLTSDLTLQRILPHINGIHSVAQIAQLADTDLTLTRKALSHLLYYDCIILLDVFRFEAVYAPTAEIGAFVEDRDAQEEAVRYVSVGRYRPVHDAGEGYGPAASLPSLDTASTPRGHGPDIGDAGTHVAGPDGSKQDATRWAWLPHEPSISCARLIQLYTSLKQGLTLSKWCAENEVLLGGIDVRRFITFGVIKGFLYRVHKYAIASHSGSPGAALEGDEISAQNGEDGVFAGDEKNWHAHAHTSMLAGSEAGSRRGSAAGSDHTHAHTHTQRHVHAGEHRDGLLGKEKLPLARYLDGMHCFDEICTELQMSEADVLGKIRSGYGDVQFVLR